MKIKSRGRQVVSNVANKFGDHLAWYFHRRTCLGVYYSACVSAQKILIRKYPEVARVAHQQQEEGGLGGDFSSFKLLELANYLWDKKPQTVIEFGGGSTTAVFALYAKQCSGVKIISVDESAHYQELTRKRLDPDSESAVMFCRADRVERDLIGKRVCHYDPDAIPELINCGPVMCYVDGPDSVSTISHKKIKIPCVDIVLLAEVGVNVSQVLFDCRFPSVTFARHAESFDAHTFSLHFRAAQGPQDWAEIDPYRYHSVAERFDIPSSEVTSVVSDGKV